LFFFTEKILDAILHSTTSLPVGLGKNTAMNPTQVSHLENSICSKTLEYLLNVSRFAQVLQKYRSKRSSEEQEIFIGTGPPPTGPVPIKTNKTA
jgi:hypothetical protein